MSKSSERKTVDQVMQEAKKIAFYGRVSTNEQQVEDGHQTAKAEQFLNRYDKKIATSFRDVKSAYSKSFRERQELENLLHALSKKEFDTLVVSDRDRLSRQTEEHFQLREVLGELGVPVVIASSGEFYDTEDFIRNLVEDALTKMESDNISVRTKAAMKSLLEREEYIGGRPSYGFEPIKEEKTQGLKVIAFSPIKEQLEKVRLIYSLYKKSETFSSIAKLLSEKYSSENWSTTKIKGIITNPIYTGFSVHKRYTVVDGKRVFTPIESWKWFPCKLLKNQEPTISYEDWWYCWHKYISTRKKRPRYFNTSFFLNDIVHCSCGALAIGKDQRTNIKGSGRTYGNRYYICTDKQCKNKFPANDLHDLVLGYIFKLPSPKNIIENEIKKLLNQERRNHQELIHSYRSMVLAEEKNLKLLESFSKDEKMDDRLLYESRNEKLIAYLLSKTDSEEKLKKYSNLLKYHIALMKRIDELLLKDSLIKERVDGFFTKEHWKLQSNPEVRNLVLLLVEHCQWSNDCKVNLKVKTLPPKDLGLWGATTE